MNKLFPESTMILPLPITLSKNTKRNQKWFMKNLTFLKYNLLFDSQSNLRISWLLSTLFTMFRAHIHRSMRNKLIKLRNRI